MCCASASCAAYSCSASSPAQAAQRHHIYEAVYPIYKLAVGRPQNNSSKLVKPGIHNALECYARHLLVALCYDSMLLKSHAMHEQATP